MTTETIDGRSHFLIIASMKKWVTGMASDGRRG